MTDIPSLVRTPSRSPTFIIVRHGQRADEDDRIAWAEHVEATCSSKNERYSRFNDPPLTPTGEQEAAAVALTLQSELRTLDTPLQYIFCSRLMRCVQTAYRIALHLQLPIVVSSGLALTAAAVEKCRLHRSCFQFTKMEDIRSICKDVEVIDGDESAQVNLLLPYDSWEAPLKFLSANFPTSLIVAHRETIRNISNLRQPIPYCAYAVMNVSEKDNFVHLDRLMSLDGHKIEIVTAK